MRFTKTICTLTLMLAALAVLARAGASEAAALQPSCPNPREVQGFLTCADVAKAEAEGAVVFYSPDVERQLVFHRPPQEQFNEGEEVYLSVEPEYCVLLEG